MASRFKWYRHCLINGLMFIKTNSGPGWNCKSKAALMFCCDMHREGVHLGPGLPKATLLNQEMDDWFQDFKGRTDAKAQEILEQKVYK